MTQLNIKHLLASIGPALLITGAVLLTSCAQTSTTAKTTPLKVTPTPKPKPVFTQPTGPVLKNKTFTTFDGDNFGYHKWGNLKSPKLVIVGSHGICGAADDFDAFAGFITEKRKDVAIYAFNTRGQGYDPIQQRKGDIHNPEEWEADLKTFNRLIRAKHPNAEIVWYGESMGALISAHTLANDKQPASLCDRLILSAPIVSLDGKISGWQQSLLKGAAFLLPRLKIPLSALAGGKEFEITEGVKHDDDGPKGNDYHIEKFSLRLLNQLGDHIGGMNQCAGKIPQATLVVHGGQDFFSSKEEVEKFTNQFPSESKLLHYPEAFHLILYDDLREKIFTDILNWLNQESASEK